MMDILYYKIERNFFVSAAHLRVERVKEAVVVELEVGRADLDRPSPHHRRRGRFALYRGAIVDPRFGGGLFLELFVLCLFSRRHLKK